MASIVSQAQARKLVELAGQGKIKARDGKSGASVVADMLRRAPDIRTLPERVRPKSDRG